jgi:GMP synthase (glutamine-hydrolysing)
VVHAGDFDTVLVVDFGAQYAQLIARRVRECHVYSEIVPATMPAEQILARRPRAVILSGGPASVYAEGAPPLPAGLLAAGVPMLGICYGFQLMVSGLGGSVAHTGAGEYGATSLELLPSPGAAAAGGPKPGAAAGGRQADAVAGGREADAVAGGREAGAATLPGGTLLSGLPPHQQVWMSHGDTCTVAPPGFTVTARTAATPVAAVEAPGQGLYGVQFHPEVLHTQHGMEVLRRFLTAVGCRQDWTMQSIIDEQIARIAEQVGGARAICGLSGGVDSAVAAALVQRAIGPRLACVFVDHGLLRKGEAEQVEKDFVAATGVDLHTVSAAGAFLTALAGVVEPEEKRRVIGREFIRAFERATREIAAEAGAHGEAVEFLVQGTLYPDVVESGGGTGTASIKSHHNVGGLPADLGFKLVEPLRGLFKDEVRRIGEELGLPREIVWRQPFPGPGLGIRIVGEITLERLQILREADAIVREELSRAGLDADIWQCPVVLLADIRSVGVQGDFRTYGHPVVLRPVTSEDAMTADWARLPDPLLAAISTRITNEVPQINRVVVDITSKPPGTIELE